MVRRNPLTLHRVFHSIRFKVNKGWSTAVLLFLCYITIAFKNFIKFLAIFNKIL